MLRFLARRLTAGILALWIVATLTFALMHALPGDYFTGEKKLPEAVLNNIRERYHLNDPLWKQYVDYMGNLLQGDMGPSFRYTTRTVNDIIETGFPVSATVGGLALGMALVLGIPAGIAAALRRNGWIDNLITFLTTLGISQPNFVIATVLMYYLGYKWHILPPALWGQTWQQAVMPVIALSFFPSAYIARLVRSNMLEIVSQDYMRTAKAKGLPGLLIMAKHGLRNALLPVLTVLGPMSAAILTGSFVVERIFNIPGLGRDFVDSVLNRDYSVIMGVTVFYAALIIVLNLAVDLLYGLVDPRIKVAGGKG